MIFRKTITVPANTGKEKPLTTVISVQPGVLEKGEIFFPPGCHGLVGVRILWRGNVIWPSPDTSQEWFVADDYTVEFGAMEDQFEITDPPYEFTIQAYNEDQVYEHLLYVRFKLVKSSAHFMELPEPGVQAVDPALLAILQDLHSAVEELRGSIRQLAEGIYVLQEARRTLRQTDRFFDP